MSLENVVQEGREYFEGVKRLIGESRGYIFAGIIGAGLMLGASSIIGREETASEKALANLKPKIDYNQPSRFELKGNEVYLNYDSQGPVKMPIKYSKDRVPYLQGIEGGEIVLIPAIIDENKKIFPAK